MMDRIMKIWEGGFGSWRLVGTYGLVLEGMVGQDRRTIYD